MKKDWPMLKENKIIEKYLWVSKIWVWQTRTSKKLLYFYRIKGNQVWRIKGTNGGNDSTSKESQLKNRNFKEEKGNSGVET